MNVKNCTITQTTTNNQLNNIGRDSNAGLNSGVLFGEIGVYGLPMNQLPIENSSPTANGLLQGAMNN